MFLFKIIGKFIGIILIITGAAGIVSFIIGLFTVGILDIIHIPGMEYYYMVNATSIPVWMVSLLVFFAIGIPFFFLMYLGLKILVNNLKSIGNIAKFSLLGLWLISIILLTVFGISQAAAHAYSGNVTVKKVLPLEAPNQLITVNLNSSNWQEQDNNLGFSGVILDYTEDGEEILVLDDLRFYIKSSKDSLAHIEIRKKANGKSLRNATETAGKIDYSYDLKDNTLMLDDFLSTAKNNKFRDQEVRVNLLLPLGAKVQFKNFPKRCWMLRTDNDQDMNGCEITEHLWIMGVNGVLECQDCPEKEKKDKKSDGKGRIIINEDGVDIDLKDGKDSFKMKIDKQGVQIKTGENKPNNVIGDTVQ